MYFRPLPILTVATVAALAILIGLGLWQLERREEKHALMAQIARNVQAAPEAIETLLTEGENAAFRPVTAQGTYDQAREVYVFAPRLDDGPTVPGYKVITPLKLNAGAYVFVDRGWVPQAGQGPDPARLKPLGADVQIAGTLRPPTVPGWFTPAPDAARRLWYARDIPGIAAAMAVKPATDFFIESASVSEGGPEPAVVAPDIPDNHLQYAITWFALALTLVVVYAAFHHSRGRLGFRR